MKSRNIGMVLKHLLAAANHTHENQEARHDYLFGGVSARNKMVTQIQDAVREAVAAFRLLKAPSDQETKDFNEGLKLLDGFLIDDDALDKTLNDKPVH